MKQLVYLANCCFNSCAEQSHKDNVRRATVEEQLKQKVVQLSEPSSTSQLLISPGLSRGSSYTSQLLISPGLSRGSSSTSQLLISPGLSRGSSSTSPLLISGPANTQMIVQLFVRVQLDTSLLLSRLDSVHPNTKLWFTTSFHNWLRHRSRKTV